jgi:hypothetical protein
MIRDTSVKFFDSSWSDLYYLSGSTGRILEIFNQCLTGEYFNSFTIDSISIDANGICTLVKSGHSLANPGESAGIDVGVVIELKNFSGNWTGLNREWRATVVSSTTLTWFCGKNLPIGPVSVTGSERFSRASAKFQTVYGPTSNVKVYRPSDASSTRYYLRVSDNSTTISTLRLYGAMTGISTGTDPTPTTAQETNGIVIPKAVAGNGTFRHWLLATDGNSVILCTAPGSSSGTGFYYNEPYSLITFGDLVSSPKLVDPWKFYITGGRSAATGALEANHVGSGIGSSKAAYVGREYGASGTSVACIKEPIFTGADHAGQLSIDQNGYAGYTAPHPADGTIWVEPIAVKQNNHFRRGYQAGLYIPMHARPFTKGSVVQLSNGMIAKVVPTISNGGGSWTSSTTPGQTLIDLIGPWRKRV